MAEAKKEYEDGEDVAGNDSDDGSGDSDRELKPMKHFGFGCSLEEHIRFGQCLDGKCCQRSQVEIRNSRHLQEKETQVAKNRRRTALTKKLMVRQKTALHYASFHGELEVIHKLCKFNDANLDAVDEHGRTALHEACAEGHVRVVQRLLTNDHFPYTTPLGYLSRRKGKLSCPLIGGIRKVLCVFIQLSKQ